MLDEISRRHELQDWLDDLHSTATANCDGTRMPKSANANGLQNMYESTLISNDQALPPAQLKMPGVIHVNLM